YALPEARSLRGPGRRDRLRGIRGAQQVAAAPRAVLDRSDPLSVVIAVSVVGPLPRPRAGAYFFAALPPPADPSRPAAQHPAGQEGRAQHRVLAGRPLDVGK